MSRRILALAAIVLLFAGRAEAQQLQQEFRLWAKIRFELQEWKAPTINRLLLTEGFEAGSQGYLVDPYLLNYEVSGGLSDYHLQRQGDWDNYLGWQARALLRVIPMSKFPLEIFAGHTALGLRPGAHPAFNLVSTTDFGGRMSLRFDPWPQIDLRTRYALTDSNLGPGDYPLVFGETLQAVRETRWFSLLEVRGSNKGHNYWMQLAHLDERNEGIDQRIRRERFYFEDRAMLAAKLQVVGSVSGEVGELGDRTLEGATPFHDYRARLALQYGSRRDLAVFARTVFRQTRWAETQQINAESTTEVYWMPRKWLELFAGLALTYVDESALDVQQRIAREQLGLGARVLLPVPGLGGRLEAKLLGRLGDSQALELGRGLFFALDSYLQWTHPFRRVIEVFLRGRAFRIHDRSPLGADAGLYEGRVGLSRSGKTVNVQGYAFIAHHLQEELEQGSYTDTYQDAGGQLDVFWRAWDWLMARASAGFSYYFYSELGAQSGVNAGALLAAQPAENLRIQSSLRYFGRLQGGAQFTTLRFESDLSWRLRQLSVEATYLFILDDYLGLPRGDHRVMVRLTRAFDMSLGRRR